MATITVGTNSYVTEAELTTYATDRGVTLSGATDVLLIQAMDWLELQPFRGEKADASQDLEFPRDDETTVPERIKQAQMAAALVIDDGGELMGAIGPRVTQESVDGAVSVSYSDRGNQTTLYPRLNALLRPYVASSGSSFDVVRV